MFEKVVCKKWMVKGSLLRIVFTIQKSIIISLPLFFSLDLQIYFQMVKEELKMVEIKI